MQPQRVKFQLLTNIDDKIESVTARCSARPGADELISHLYEHGEGRQPKFARALALAASSALAIVFLTRARL